MILFHLVLERQESAHILKMTQLRSKEEQDIIICLLYNGFIKFSKEL